jgi:feruloyl esterase
MKRTAWVFAAAATIASAGSRVQTATSCESLASLALPQATITSAAIVGAGAFTPPNGRGGAGRGGAVFASLPSFCRVAATLKPSSDSDIKVEVWLPASGWNGKLQAVGNGGWAGTISYPALAAAVASGYAGVSTDTGHVGGTAQFALGHPEKLADLAYRSQHEMTVKAKAIITAHYGNAPKLSIWNGCSQGGRQGLAEAQRYPADFDGIITGAAAWNQAQLHAGRLTINTFANRGAGSNVPREKYQMVHDAVLNACDALDGVKDGVIENPARCKFDPKVLQCEGVDGPNCLTAAQVETARALYAPVKNPNSGAVIYPALQPGSELVWNVTGGTEPIGTALEAFKFVVFGDANWDWRRFDPSTDIEKTVRAFDVMATNNTNLKPFFDRGGKLMMYHGWNDTQVAPEQSTTYFNAVTSLAGKGSIAKSIQLYMVPGMNHCAGGPGTDSFDKMAAMESWIATGKAPESIVASHMTDGKPDRTRPLCPYGKVAKWKGAGSTDEAANFTCVAQ